MDSVLAVSKLYISIYLLADYVHFSDLITSLPYFLPSLQNLPVIHYSLAIYRSQTYSFEIANTSQLQRLTCTGKQVICLVLHKQNYWFCHNALNTPPPPDPWRFSAGPLCRAGVNVRLWRGGGITYGGVELLHQVGQLLFELGSHRAQSQSAASRSLPAGGPEAQYRHPHPLPNSALAPKSRPRSCLMSQHSPRQSFAKPSIHSLVHACGMVAYT